MAADILTFGLWEAVGTPLELGAQDRPVTWIVKYDAAGKIVEIETLK